jgi:nucleoside-diphosphate-sugar epimerase
VGSHAAQWFLEHEWHVKALLRRPDRPGRMPAGVQIVTGELNEPAAYRPEMEGCDAVLHAAGAVKARNLGEFRRANTRGTAALVEAANQACPKAMFVYVSSQAAAGPAVDGRPVREQDPPHPVSWYGQSKFEAEEAVAHGFGGAWCIVRPSAVYGPGDPGFLQLFATVARGIAPRLAGGVQWVQLLAAGDLARILGATVQRPDLHGRRGFAAGETATTGQIVGELAALRQPPARILPIPALMLRLAGRFESLRESITGRTRPFNRDKVRELLAADWLCDPQPFLGDLGINGLQGWKEGLREACRWYIKEHWLPPRFANV